MGDNDDNEGLIFDYEENKRQCDDTKFDKIHGASSHPYDTKIDGVISIAAIPIPAGEGGYGHSDNPLTYNDWSKTMLTDENYNNNGWPSIFKSIFELWLGIIPQTEIGTPMLRGDKLTNAETYQDVQKLLKDKKGKPIPYNLTTDTKPEGSHYFEKAVAERIREIYNNFDVTAYNSTSAIAAAAGPNNNRNNNANSEPDIRLIQNTPSHSISRFFVQDDVSSTDHSSSENINNDNDENNDTNSMNIISPTQNMVPNTATTSIMNQLTINNVNNTDPNTSTLSRLRQQTESHQSTHSTNTLLHRQQTNNQRRQRHGRTSGTQNTTDGGGGEQKYEEKIKVIVQRLKKKDNPSEYAGLIFYFVKMDPNFNPGKAVSNLCIYKDKIAQPLCKKQLPQHVVNRYESMADENFLFHITPEIYADICLKYMDGIYDIIDDKQQQHQQENDNSCSSFDDNEDDEEEHETDGLRECSNKSFAMSSHPYHPMKVFEPFLAFKYMDTLGADVSECYNFINHDNNNNTYSIKCGDGNDAWHIDSQYFFWNRKNEPGLDNNYLPWVKTPFMPPPAVSNTTTAITNLVITSPNTLQQQQQQPRQLSRRRQKRLNRKINVTRRLQTSPYMRMQAKTRGISIENMNFGNNNRTHIFPTTITTTASSSGIISPLSTLSPPPKPLPANVGTGVSPQGKMNWVIRLSEKSQYYYQHITSFCPKMGVNFNDPTSVMKYNEYVEQRNGFEHCLGRYFDKEIWDLPSLVPKGLLHIINFHKGRNNMRRVSKMIHPSDTEMDHFANWMTLVGTVFRFDQLIAINTRDAILTHYGSKDAYRYFLGLHWNWIATGPGGSSKSVILELLIFLSIIGTIDDIVNESLMAGNVDGDCSDLITIHDEAPVYLMRSSDKEHAAQGAAAKARISGARVKRKVFEFVEKANGKKIRTARTVSTNHIGCTLTATNAPFSNMEPSMATRFHRAIFTHWSAKFDKDEEKDSPEGSPKLRVASVFDLKGINWNSNDLKRIRGQKTFFKIKQALTALTNKLMQCNILPEPNMEVCHHVLNKLLHYLSHKGKVKIGSYRSYQRIIALARVFTIENAINAVFNTPGSDLYGKEFKVQDMLLLKPYLCCTVQIAIYAFTLSSDEYINDTLGEIFKAAVACTNYNVKERGRALKAGLTPSSQEKDYLCDDERIIQWREIVSSSTTSSSNNFNSSTNQHAATAGAGNGNNRFSSNTGTRKLDLNYVTLNGSRKTVARKIRAQMSPKPSMEDIESLLMNLQDHPVEVENARKPMTEEEIVSSASLNNHTTNNNNDAENEMNSTEENCDDNSPSSPTTGRTSRQILNGVERTFDRQHGESWHFCIYALDTIVSDGLIENAIKSISYDKFKSRKLLTGLIENAYRGCFKTVTVEPNPEKKFKVFSAAYMTTDERNLLYFASNWDPNSLENDKDIYQDYNVTMEDINSAMDKTRSQQFIEINEDLDEWAMRRHCEQSGVPLVKDPSPANIDGQGVKWKFTHPVTRKSELRDLPTPHSENERIKLWIRKHENIRRKHNAAYPKDQLEPLPLSQQIQHLTNNGNVVNSISSPVSTLSSNSMLLDNDMDRMNINSRETNSNSISSNDDSYESNNQIRRRTREDDHISSHRISSSYFMDENSRHGFPEAVEEEEQLNTSRINQKHRDIISNMLSLNNDNSNTIPDASLNTLRLSQKRRREENINNSNDEEEEDNLNIRSSSTISNDNTTYGDIMDMDLEFAPELKKRRKNTSSNTTQNTQQPQTHVQQQQNIGSSVLNMF